MRIYTGSQEPREGGGSDDDETPEALHWSYRNLQQFPAGMPRRAEHLYLKENGICRLPKDLSYLRGIKGLYLAGNELAEVPRSLGALSRLQILDLSANRLVCIPAELGDLPRLHTLLLDDNLLKFLPPRLGRAPLRLLSVCENRLAWLPQRLAYGCDVRVWRNPPLRALPHRLWFHSLRSRRLPCYALCCGGSDVADAPAIGYRNLAARSPPPLRELCLRAAYALSSVPAHTLPQALWRELYVGPPYCCDNRACSLPLFDYVHVRHYTGEVRLVEETRAVLLTGVFCSPRCAGAELPAANPLEPSLQTGTTVDDE